MSAIRRNAAAKFFKLFDRDAPWLWLAGSMQSVLWLTSGRAFGEAFYIYCITPCSSNRVAAYVISSLPSVWFKDQIAIDDYSHRETRSDSQRQGL